MKLISSPTSPYARKARILIIELGLEDKIDIESVVAMQDPPQLHAANPLGKVPALLINDDHVLYDSPVICEYIDAENGGRFLPSSGAARWDCLRRQGLGDGVTDASFLRTAERAKPESERSKMWWQRWSMAIMRSLDVMESDIAKAGDRFDLGDVTFACALGYLDLRHEDMNWRQGHKVLADWFLRHEGRESVKNTVPPR